MHRSSTDKFRCSKTGAGSSDSGTGSSSMTTGGCSSGAGVRGSGSSSSMRRQSSSGSSSGTGGCAGSSSTGAVSGTTPALLDLKRLPATCASPAASKTDAACSQKLLNKCTAIKSGEFTDTAPAESPRSLQQSAPGSVVPENARPPVLSPDACQRPAPRTSTRAVA